jgi:hypothetical protein
MHHLTLVRQFNICPAGPSIQVIPDTLAVPRHHNFTQYTSIVVEKGEAKFEDAVHKF